MKLIPILQLNQKLLTGTAVLGLGSIVAGAIGGPVLSGIANFTAGMVGNNLGALVEKLRNSRDVLRNQDLAKAAGRSVGLALGKISSDFPEIQEPLKALAEKTEGYWLEWAEGAKTLKLFESVREEQLVKVFANDPQEFAQYRVLEKEEWRVVVTWLFQRGCEKGVLFPSGSLEEDFGDVIDALAGELEGNFQKNLREVLKDDAANGGEAFAGMLLDLHGATLAQIQDIKEALSGLATRKDMCLLLQAIERLSQPKPDSRDKVLPSLGAVDTVPKLPPHFLPRPEDLQELKGRLLAPATQTVVMTGQRRQVGLQGMGGIGKTVLAAAVARDTEVRRRFRHGVVWLTVGVRPKPIELYQRVATTLGESYAYQEGDAQWNAYLSNLLREKSCLLVLDDVWQQGEAERFVEILGEDCRLLLTTRDAGLIAGLGAEGYRVEMLAEEQARLLLANWAGVEMLPPEAAQVVKHCGKLPLALALSGAQVALGTSWADLLAALEAADLRFLDYPHGSIYKSLEASVGVLEERKGRAYLELGLVAPDVEVSEAALVKLWGRDGDLPDYRARGWLTEFAQRALVFVRGESPERWVSLHDVQQKYLQENLQNAAALHREWLRGYGGGKFPWSGAEVEVEEKDVYLYGQGAYHFLAAGEEEAFGQLLGDFDWLQRKLAATDIEGVLADFAVLSSPDPFLSRLERTLRLSAHVLNEDKSQLASQLWGRLLEPEKMRRFGYRYFWEKIPFLGRYLPQYRCGGRVEQLLQQARARQQGLWFRPLFPCFDSPYGRLIQTFAGHKIYAVAIAPDGKRGLSGSFDNTLKLWDLESGRELRTFTGHSSGVHAVAIAPDGKRGLSGSWDNTLKLWDLESGRELRTFTGHSSGVHAVAIAPDGKRGLSGSEDDTLKLWDLESGRELRTFTGHSDRVNAVAIAPDGKRGLSGSEDKTLKLWDLESGRELRSFTGHSSEVNAVAIAPDGKRGLSGSEDNTLKLWDLESGRELRSFRSKTHFLPGPCINAVAIAPDGKRGLSGSSDETLKLWDLESGQELRSFTGHSRGVKAVAIAPDGKRGFSGSFDNTLKLWDLESGQELRSFTGHSRGVKAVAIAPDGKRGLSGSRDNTLKLWDLESGRELRTFTRHNSEVNAVAIHPDGKRGLSGSYDMKLWDFKSGRKLRTFIGHSLPITAVAIHPDGLRALSGSWDNTLKLWDLESGRELRTFTGHNSRVNAVAIHPDGKRGLSGSRDNTLKLWDLESGRELRTFTCHSYWVYAVAIAESGRKLRTFIGHSLPITAVAIHPDGKRGLSGSSDNSLKLWDLESGEVQATFTVDAAVVSCAIAPDGRTIVAGDSSGRMYFLRLEGGLSGSSSVS